MRHIIQPLQTKYVCSIPTCITFYTSFNYPFRKSLTLYCPKYVRGKSWRGRTTFWGGSWKSALKQGRKVRPRLEHLTPLVFVFYHVLERRRRGERPCFLAKRPFFEDQAKPHCCFWWVGLKFRKEGRLLLLLSDVCYFHLLLVYSFFLTVCGLRANFQIVKNVKSYYY